MSGVFDYSGLLERDGSNVLAKEARGRTFKCSSHVSVLGMVHVLMSSVLGGKDAWGWPAIRHSLLGKLQVQNPRWTAPVASSWS